MIFIFWYIDPTIQIQSKPSIEKCAQSACLQDNWIQISTPSITLQLSLRRLSSWQGFLCQVVAAAGRSSALIQRCDACPCQQVLCNVLVCATEPDYNTTSCSCRAAFDALGRMCTTCRVIAARCQGLSQSFAVHAAEQELVPLPRPVFARKWTLDCCQWKHTFLFAASCTAHTQTQRACSRVQFLLYPPGYRQL